MPKVSYNAVISACATAGEWLWAFQLLDPGLASDVWAEKLCLAAMNE